MANKFQKSVFERLEQESSRQKKVRGSIEQQEKAQPVVEEPDPAPPKKPVQRSKPIKETQQKPDPPKEAVDTKQSPAGVWTPTDIGEFLRPIPQRQAKNKTFYLDGDVIAAVKSTAKAQRVTDSRLVNDILRRVLGVDE